MAGLHLQYTNKDMRQSGESFQKVNVFQTNLIIVTSVVSSTLSNYFKSLAKAIIR